MPAVIRTPRARRDLAEIWEFTAPRNPWAADELLRTIQVKAELLARSPHLGRHRDELAPGLRSFPVGRYILFYRQTEGGIEVIRVLHGARDLDDLLPK